MKGNYISRPSFKKSNKSKLGVVVCSSIEEEATNDFITEFIHLMSTENINYEILILSKNSANINTNSLYNIGFDIAKEKNCDYIIFQNEDFIPTKSTIGYYKSYPINPINLSYHITKNDMNVLSISTHDFESINKFGKNKNDFIKLLSRHNIKMNIPSSGSFNIHKKNDLLIKEKEYKRKKKMSIIESQVLSDNVYYYTVG